MVTRLSLSLLTVTFTAFLSCSSMVQTLRPLKKITTNKGTTSLTYPKTRGLIRTHQTKRFSVRDVLNDRSTSTKNISNLKSTTARFSKLRLTSVKDPLTTSWKTWSMSLEETGTPS